MSINRLALLAMRRRRYLQTVQFPVEFDHWHPGVLSRIPRDIRHLATIHRPENVFTALTQAEELHDLTGLPVSELVAFRPQRLALHELLVRVTADFSIPDGARIEDLGINFRRTVSTILTKYLTPEQEAIDAAYALVRRALAAAIENELAVLYPAPQGKAAATTAAGRLRALFQRPREAEPSADAGVDAESAAIAAWETAARTPGDEVRAAACRALARVASALFVRHGRLWGSRETIAGLALDLACNAYGSERIGREIEPLVARAVAGEGFALLPRQELPVVFNTKGASASGKSTLRPRQRQLARDIGVEWSEFAIISPDIWRKQLLDYGTLGASYKYGGPFTGEELSIIDHKLDAYMARKAERGDMTHLLIDRFRFDSFAPESDEAGSNLLTRFGHDVYLFFMITPPEMLVERAWKRGLEVGRYKAVDDTLAHGIVAYAGMPGLLFTWAKRDDKRVQFELLDNSVRAGERPRTVGFGSNRTLNVLDVRSLLDVERYRRVNVDATSPDELYRDEELLRPERNAGFLKQCLEHFPQVSFAEHATGRIYLVIAAGAPVWADRAALESAVADPETRAGLLAVMPSLLDRPLPGDEGPRYLADRAATAGLGTLGAWGPPSAGDPRP
jgi:hypothetical protein